MIIGAMNNPHKKLADEIHAIGELSFDYIEVTVEHPYATPDIIGKSRKEISDAIHSYNLGVLAHLPWYFSLAHPYQSIQQAVNREFARAFESAASLGAKQITLHTETMSPSIQSRENHVANTIATLKTLNKTAKEHGLDLLVENLDAKSFSIKEFKALFSEVDMGMTFDIGHANTPRGEGFDAYWRAFSGRIRHVHMHDNRLKDDDHLPLYAGKIDWDYIIPTLKSHYDKSITLEVHSEDRHYLAYSKEKLEQMWFGKRRAAEDKEYLYPKGYKPLA
jgi:sugar phosphate isomerase/epimerase